MVIAPTFAESNGEVLDGNSDGYAFWVKKMSQNCFQGEGVWKVEIARGAETIVWQYGHRFHFSC